MKWARSSGIVLAIAIAGVAGCSNSDGAEPTSTTTSRASPQTGGSDTAAADQPAVTSAGSPLPTGTTPLDYGVQYLTLIEPWNCALERFQNELNYIIGEDGFFTEDEWPSIREPINKSGADMAAATVAAIEGFVAAQWPAELGADIDALVGELSTEAGIYNQIAGVETIEQWNLVAEGPVRENSAATIVRAKLGLPSNIGNETLCP